MVSDTITRYDQAADALREGWKRATPQVRGVAATARPLRTRPYLQYQVSSYVV